MGGLGRLEKEACRFHNYQAQPNVGLVRALDVYLAFRADCLFEKFRLVFQRVHPPVEHEWLRWESR